VTPETRSAPRGAVLLRVYALASDRFQGRALTTAIVGAAREAELAGATVLPAIMGYGRHGYETALSVALYQPEKQPMIVELVDDAERILAFLPTLQAMNVEGRLTTLVRLEVRSYRSGSEPGGSTDDG
jgi:uncharacterized protein